MNAHLGQQINNLEDLVTEGPSSQVRVSQHIEALACGSGKDCRETDF